jgi:fatty-acyl-CoA synthase
MAPAGTVAGMLLARQDDDNVGLLFHDSSYTWRQVVNDATARASVLRWLLRRPRPMHVGVLLDNVPEYVFLLGGAALAGAVIVGINPTRRGAELARDIRHTDCQLIITSDDHLSLLEGLELGEAGDPTIVVLGEWWELLVADHRQSGIAGRLPEPEDLFVLMFTSGSTGDPKAVRCTQGRAAAGAAASRFRSSDVLYCPMPLFHGHALAASLLPAIHAGATVALRSRFSASGYLPDVRRYGCTFASTIGRGLAHILATPAGPDDRDHRLRVVLAPEASSSDMAAFTERFGCPVIEGYGSSENAIVLVPVPGMPAGSLGQPKPGDDIAIIDPTTEKECAPARFDAAGQLLNPAEAIGEIVGRNTAGRFEGYYKSPDADTERIRGGWYWSGDLGYRDEQGFFWFAGRMGDRIRVDGENFTAAPIERILARWPVAAGVAVFAVPDRRTADQVMAAIEVRPGALFDPDAFDQFLAAQPDLGTKWAPTFIRVMSQLPVTPTNKVDKKPLRAERWATTDAVWWRPERGGPYRRMTADDVADLEAAFVANHRTHLLGPALSVWRR